MKLKPFLFLFIFFQIHGLISDKIIDAIADDYGWAYLIMVTNNTPFTSYLEFSDAKKIKVISPGQTLGEKPILPKDVASYAPIVQGRNAIIDKNGENISKSRVTRKPEISGFGRTLINNFFPQSLLILEPFYNSGAAWFATKDFQLDTTVEFLAYVENKGKAIVCFSDKQDKDSLLKVEFAADDVCVLKVKNKVVAQAKSNFKTDSSLKPSDFKKFWINISENGQILVGQGEAGENVFLVHHDFDLVQKLRKIGFSTSDFKVIFSQIKVLPNLVFNQNQNVIFESENFNLNSLQLQTPGQAWLHLKLSSSVDFLNQDSEKIFSIFPENKGIKINFLKSKKEYFFDNVDLNSHSVFLNLDRENLILGVKNESNQIKILDVFKKTEIDNAAFLKMSQGKIILSNPTKLELENSFKKVISQLTGSLQIIRPYHYQLDQQGPAVMIKDMFSGKSFVLGQAAQKAALYSFELLIKKDGTPVLKSDYDPINPTKFTLKAVATALRVTEGSFFYQADSVVEENADDIQTQLSLTVQNAQYAIAGALLRISAADIESALEHDFVHESETYVFKDDNVLSGSTVDSNRHVESEQLSKINTHFNLLVNLDLTVRQDFDSAMSHVNKILELFDSDKIVLSAAKKTFLFKVVMNLAQGLDAIKSIEKEAIRFSSQTEVLAKGSLDVDVLQLLDKVINHKFFIKNQDKNDLAQVELLKTFFKNISENYFSQTLSQHLIPLTEQVLWLNNFVSSENGFFIFQILGSGKFDLIFSQDKKFYNSSKQIYQLSFSDNLELKLIPEGKAVKTISKFENSNIFFNSIEPKIFWIKFANKEIFVGSGLDFDNVIFSWVNPYPELGNLIPGFSSQGRIELLNFFSSGISKDFDLEKFWQEKIQEKNERIEENKKNDESLQSQDIENLLKDIVQTDPLLKDLNRMEREYFSDYLMFAIYETIYDSLTYDTLGFEFKQALHEAGEVVDSDFERPISSVKDLDYEKKEVKKDVEFSHEDRVAMQKAMAAGIGGIKEELRGESADIKDILSSSKNFGKKIFRAAQGKDHKDISIFETSGSYKMIKDDIAQIKSLFAGKNKVVTSDGKEVFQYKAQGPLKDGQSEKDRDFVFQDKDGNKVELSDDDKAKGTQRARYANVFQEYKAQVEESGIMNEIKNKMKKKLKDSGTSDKELDFKILSKLKELPLKIKRALDGKRISSALKDKVTKAKNSVSKKVSAYKEKKKKEKEDWDKLSKGEKNEIRFNKVSGVVEKTGSAYAGAITSSGQENISSLIGSDQVAPEEEELQLDAQAALNLQDNSLQTPF